MQPFFSVVITSYNSEQTILTTVKSVLKQRCQDFELLIIDDHSTDSTKRLLTQYLTSTSINYQLIPLSVNQGVSHARNIGIENCSGQFVAFLDGDDIWLPNKLAIQKRFILDHHVNWIFSNYNVVNEEYQQIATRYRLPGVYDFKKIIKTGNPIGLLTVVVRRSLLEDNLFKNVPHEDYDLWLRLSKQGEKAVLLNESLANYMKKSGSVSSNKIKAAWWTFHIFRINGISRWVSTMLMFGYFKNVIFRQHETSISNEKF